jgi:hypothetical protein
MTRHIAGTFLAVIMVLGCDSRSPKPQPPTTSSPSESAASSSQAAMGASAPAAGEAGQRPQASPTSNPIAIQRRTPAERAMVVDIDGNLQRHVSPPQAVETEALNLVESERKRTHTDIDDDTWITELPNGVVSVFKKMTYEISRHALSEADRLNGVEWAGSVTARALAMKEKFPGQPNWGEWQSLGGGVDVVHADLQKKNGQWVWQSSFATAWRQNKKPSPSKYPPEFRKTDPTAESRRKSIVAAAMTQTTSKKYRVRGEPIMKGLFKEPNPGVFEATITDVSVTRPQGADAGGGSSDELTIAYADLVNAELYDQYPQDPGVKLNRRAMSGGQEDTYPVFVFFLDINAAKQFLADVSAAHHAWINKFLPSLTAADVAKFYASTREERLLMLGEAADSATSAKPANSVAH